MNLADYIIQNICDTSKTLDCDQCEYTGCPACSQHKQLPFLLEQNQTTIQIAYNNAKQNIQPDYIYGGWRAYFDEYTVPEECINDIDYLLRHLLGNASDDELIRNIDKEAVIRYTYTIEDGKHISKIDNTYKGQLVYAWPLETRQWFQYEYDRRYPPSKPAARSIV